MKSAQSKRIVISAKITDDLNKYVENAVARGVGKSKAEIVIRALTEWANRQKIAGLDFTDPVCPSCLEMINSVILKVPIKVTLEAMPGRDDARIRALCCPICHAILFFGTITDVRGLKDGHSKL